MEKENKKTEVKNVILADMHGDGVHFDPSILAQKKMAEQETKNIDDKSNGQK